MRSKCGPGLWRSGVFVEKEERGCETKGEECGAILQDLSDKINNKHQEVHTHPLLSIFKMAEVEVKLPQGSGATAIPKNEKCPLKLYIPEIIEIQL
ncbi:hypothetical protein KQX54_018004 [Cotesia glomerata]|uniref:Uncharacterized protein n=1 Tax=Cotesia glomerata TaxID=32391 RepID=A0AAV7HKZ7_COTGL|nr:hypothetical protein KQX54_018004 [Cotesia glomerata]